MHLAFVTSLIPDSRLASGFDIANASILDGLSERVDRVTLIGYVWPGSSSSRDGAMVLGEIDARTDAASFSQKLSWLGKALRLGMTFSSAKLRIADPKEISARLASFPPVDAYVWNSVQLAGAYPELFRDRPALYVAHNVEHRSARQNADAAQSAFETMLYRREATLLRRLEEGLCRDAAHILTLTEEDAADLDLAPTRSTVLPLVTRANPAAGDIAPQVDATMIGSWSWTPNRIGLLWFLNEVVPHLPEEFTVEIAGAMPEDIVPPRPQIRFVGRVPDAAAFVQRGRVVPLASRAGTGIQLKTLETLELGMAAVATESSLRGIAYLPENVAVADEPQAFAEALVRQARQAKRIDGSQFRSEQRQALGDALDRALHCLHASSRGVKAA